MIKVVVWIERVQTEYLVVKTFDNLEDAKLWIERDFITRRSNSEFINSGGYRMEELTWCAIPSPRIIKSPAIQWSE